MKALSEAALGVLSSGVVVTERELRISAQLDRKLYVEVNAAIEAIGGKWNRRAKAHVFDEDPVDALDQILVDGGFHDRKRDLDQFFTPSVLAEYAVQLADVRGHIVLEPSAGHGALAKAARDAGASSLICVEKDPKCCEVLRGAGFDPVFPIDFMEFRTSRVDRVVMNPPFSRQQDIAHVTHAHSMLSGDGKLVAIMSAGVLFRQDKKARIFRGLVDTARGTIAKLPEKAFAESGTTVHAVLVTLQGHGFRS